MNKADKDKVIAALETIFGEGLSWREIAEAHKEALTIMRGLAEDAEPVAKIEDRVLSDAVEMLSNQHEWLTKIAAINLVAGLYGRAAAVLSFENANPTSPQAAQTALKSESLAQAAQAPVQPPSEGKPIEALAPQQAAQTEAALREVVRLSEDAGLYDDFQTEAQERPAYPEGDVVGLCVCGSWSGGRCLRCEWRAGSKP